MLVHKKSFINKAVVFVCVFSAFINTMAAQNKIEMNQTIFQFTVADINGDSFDFCSLEGKKIMIVNTASDCGLTPQYKSLQSLYEKYQNSNFVIVGFPANNFLAQEPGTNEEISAFCKANYGVSFPMMGKISVIGKNMHPLFKFLTSSSENGVMDIKVTWNFQKFLINSEGILEKVIPPRTQPNDPEVIQWIEKNES